MTTPVLRLGIFGFPLLWLFGFSNIAAARDCNTNGVEDIDDIKNGVSQDCNANNIPDACEGWPIDFHAGNQWTLDRTPTGLVAGDLDLDGDVEFVVAQSSQGLSAVSVFSNLGGRAFERGQELKLLGVELSQIVLSDLNGDGLADLVGAAGHKIVTFENRGDGQFLQWVERVPFLFGETGIKAMA